jgi:glycosyltransferase involved in cell wall biosynthesis
MGGNTSGCSNTGVSRVVSSPLMPCEAPKEGQGAMRPGSARFSGGPIKESQHIDGLRGTVAPRIGASTSAGHGARCRQYHAGSPAPEPSRDRLTVLHVSESFGGGVATSIHGMIASAPEAEHTVLILRRRPHLGHQERRDGVTYIDAGEQVGFFHSLQQLAQAYRELRPDIVHAQSSYAGAYVRALLSIPRAEIVYTPHCFAFERVDLSSAKRAVLRMVERMLAWRTGTLLAVSEHEGRLADSLSGRWRVVRALNTPDLPDELMDSAQSPGPLDRVRVTAVGRICRQKDPEFFMDVVRIARRRGVDVDWTWIGDGEAHLRAGLENLGVTVTGWQDRVAGLQVLASSHICLHTAAWEVGVPMTVLEAAGMGLPSVVRSMASIDGDHIGIHVDSPAHAVSEISLLCQTEEWIRQSKQTKEAFVNVSTDRRMANALALAYQRQSLSGPAPTTINPMSN